MLLQTPKNTKKLTFFRWFCSVLPACLQVIIIAGPDNVYVCTDLYILLQIHGELGLLSMVIISNLNTAAKQGLTIRILNVKNKSLRLENQFVDVSSVLHKLHYNVSQVYLENLITKKNQIFLRGFLLNFVFL